MDDLADYEKSMNEEDLVILFNTMGSAASRVCGSSSPTVSLSDICQRMRCLVACCGSEVHIELKDVIDNHEDEHAKEEETRTFIRRRNFYRNCIL